MTTSVRLGEPGDLVAAVPYMLGFYPTKSVIVITVRGHGAVVDMVLRTEIVPDSAAQDLADTVSRYVVQDRSDGTAAVVVVIGSDNGNGEPPHAALVHCLMTTLAEGAEIPVAYAVWAACIRENEPWRLYDDPTMTGVVPDPSVRPIAAESALRGDVTFASREAMVALIDHDAEPDELDRRARLLTEMLDNPGDMSHDDRVDAIRQAVSQVRAEVPKIAGEQLIRLVAALSEPRARDVAVEISAGRSAVAAEQVWLALTRAVPAPYRAVPATLLALSAYLRGSGTLARIALDTALTADPGHSLASLLAHALDLGMSPLELADLTKAGGHLR